MTGQSLIETLLIFFPHFYEFFCAWAGRIIELICALDETVLKNDFLFFPGPAT